VAHPVDLFSAQHLNPKHISFERLHKQPPLKRKLDGLGINGDHRPLKESCRSIGFVEGMPPVNLPPRFFFSAATQSSSKKTSPKTNSSHSPVTCTSCVRSKVSLLFVIFFSSVFFLRSPELTSKYLLQVKCEMSYPCARCTRLKLECKPRPVLRRGGRQPRAQVANSDSDISVVSPRLESAFALQNSHEPIAFVVPSLTLTGIASV
jgi:hypothetical protein